MRRSAKFLAAALLLLAVPPARLPAGDTGPGEQPKEKEKNDEIIVPIPVNHGAKGVKLPYRNADGKLEMIFCMESAFRADNDHLEMKQVKMETYGADGKPEMTIEMPSSTLDLSTRIVKSKEPVTIKRTDIEVTGETMEFDTKTRSGKITGQVRLVIYNLNPGTEQDKK